MFTNSLLLFLVLQGTSPVDTTQKISPLLGTKPATIFIHREGQWLSSGRKYWVYVNNQPLGKLSNEGHCQVTLPAGTATFTTRLAGISLIPKQRSTLMLQVKSGQTYYLRATVKVVPLALQAIMPLEPMP